MSLDLEAVRVFLRVAELGSFTRAASQLGLAKSRASLLVQGLEQQLGAKLLQRTTRSVALTEEGELFVTRGRALLTEADELTSLFAASRSLKGRLRIDLPAGLARDLVIPRLPEFLALHPGLELQLSATDRRVDVMREGFDCVLRVGPPGESSLQVRRLGLMPNINCASASYLARYGTPKTLEELSAHYVVHYSSKLSGDHCGFEYFDGARYREVPMRALVTVNNVDAYRAACLAGLGIVQLPRSGVLSSLARGELVEVLPSFAAAPMPVSLVHAYGRSVPRRVRVFMDWLARLLTPYFAQHGVTQGGRTG